MKKQPYMPSDEAGLLIWFTNFVTKFTAGYYSTLGFVTADAIQCTTDLAFFTFLVNFKAQLRTKASDWVTYTQTAAYGMPGVTALGALPVPPTLPATPPAMVPPNIFGRTSAVIARLKKHPAYTPAMGEDMKIIGADDTTDVNTMKPVLEIDLRAGRPNLGWVKRGMQAVDLYVDRATGAFVFLARDTEPDYLDTAALPAAGQSAVWKYKAIYVLHDTPTGQWSDVTSVSVMG